MPVRREVSKSSYRPHIISLFWYE
uniref:Uncharacterized protein n=1 Tax=Rhizophora mucronata TaxID=61149 RepID=A0A2P2PTT2_RHIMU